MVSIYQRGERDDMTISPLYTLWEEWYDHNTLQLPWKQGQVRYINNNYHTYLTDKICAIRPQSSSMSTYITVNIQTGITCGHFHSQTHHRPHTCKRIQIFTFAYLFMAGAKAMPYLSRPVIEFWWTLSLTRETWADSVLSRPVYLAAKSWPSGVIWAYQTKLNTILVLRCIIDVWKV